MPQWVLLLNAADIAAIVMAVGWLVLLEGLLSGDNALVLAVMVRPLPREQQKKALRYGIWGAFAFRLIAVVLASFLLHFWQLKVGGGLYLVFLAIKHFLSGHDTHEPATPTTEDFEQAAAPTVDLADAPAPGKPRLDRNFWMTVVNVELTDIIFSIDSILAAVATVEGLPQKVQDHQVFTLGIIYLGGILGIVAMRWVAGFFLVLLEKFKGLAAGAYFLVAWIGLKLIGGGMHDAIHADHDALLKQGWRAGLPRWAIEFPWEMNNVFFWSGMFLIVAVSMLYRSHGGEGHDRTQAVAPRST